MKSLILALLVAAAPLAAQTQSTTTTFSQQRDQQTVLETKYATATVTFAVMPGITEHQLSYVAGQSVTNLTVTVNGLSAGVANYCGTSSIIGSGTIKCRGTFDALRVAYTAYNGSGAVDATYFGSSTPPGVQLVGPLGQSIGVNNDGLKVSIPPSSDPCLNQVSTDTAISQTASAIAITGTPGFRTFVCLVRIVAGAAEITSELEGTGSACATGTIAHSGSTTAANGESFAANGGYTTTKTFVLKTGNDFCIGQSGTSRVSGKVSWVKAQ